MRRRARRWRTAHRARLEQASRRLGCSRRSSTARRAAAGRCPTAATIDLGAGDQHDQLREGRRPARRRHGRVDARAAVGHEQPALAALCLRPSATCSRPAPSTRRSTSSCWSPTTRRRTTTMPPRTATPCATRTPGIGRARDARRGLRAERRAQGHRGDVARTDTTELERGYTGQRGQDEQNRRARKAAVQTPGKALDACRRSIRAAGGIQ